MFPESAEALSTLLTSAGFYLSQVKAHSFIVFSSTLRKQSFKTLSNFFITNTVFFVFHVAKVSTLSVSCITSPLYFTLFICLKTRFYKHVTRKSRSPIPENGLYFTNKQRITPSNLPPRPAGGQCPLRDDRKGTSAPPARRSDGSAGAFFQKPCPFSGKVLPLLREFPSLRKEQA